VIGLRRGGDRFRTAAPGLESRHSFSYGRHYDPDNLGFGVLMAHNEDRLAAGAGYDRHLHRGVDIVTWVLAGALSHQHWTGPERPGDEPVVRREILGAGTAQVLRTGSGVDHAEHAAGSADVHYVQMWLASAAPAADPDYERRDFTAVLAEAERLVPPRLVAVASGRADATGTTLALSQPGAELSVARLPVGAAMEVPVAPLVHVFLARGVLAADDGTTLAAGDALRLPGSAAPTLVAVETSEVLMWTLGLGSANGT
jgi:quercetin 2,3-dioxygenase